MSEWTSWEFCYQILWWDDKLATSFLHYSWLPFYTITWKAPGCFWRTRSNVKVDLLFFGSLYMHTLLSSIATTPMSSLHKTSLLTSPPEYLALQKLHAPVLIMTTYRFVFKLYQPATLGILQPWKITHFSWLWWWVYNKTNPQDFFVDTTLADLLHSVRSKKIFVDLILMYVIVTRIDFHPTCAERRMLLIVVTMHTRIFFVPQVATKHSPCMVPDKGVLN